MNTFNDIAVNLKNKLADTSELSSVKFIMDSPSALSPNPISKIYATVGISKIVVSEGSFSGYLGLNSGEEVYGKLADIKIKIKIYSPQSLNSDSCYEGFSKIYEALLTDNSGFNVQSVSCDEIGYDNVVSAFTLASYVNISTFIGYETTNTDIENILIAKSY
ncbi:MAG: hypothetical protein RUMPE_00871 [Eubacteriales bacterium SKADARSKE-1]|nr:hypothetical protein [Eubacteriales bacterium SKADARSKE-1]